MKKTLALLTAVCLATTLNTPAVMVPVITVDEDGNISSSDGNPLPAGVLQVDPTTGAVALTYLMPSTVNPGFVGLSENGTTAPSDLISFYNLNNQGFLAFYSDLENGVGDSLADVGIPNVAPRLVLLEIGPEGNNGASYDPGAPDLSNPNPGWLFNGVGVQYQINSDTPVPEPATVLAGALLLIPLGASTFRMLRRKPAAAA